jgi:hypothetical protein
VLLLVAVELVVQVVLQHQMVEIHHLHSPQIQQSHFLLLVVVAVPHFLQALMQEMEDQVVVALGVVVVLQAMELQVKDLLEEIL